MATSSSAKKVAKLASRGRGKKVRFQSGTTFPAVLVVVIVAMIALVAYAKASMPGEETGAPQPGDQWTMAYEIRVCDQTITLQGDPADLDAENASAGDRNQLANGQANSAGFINYHPLEGGKTGRRARLGVFLDVYGVKLSNTKLTLPADQAGGTEAVYDIKDDDVFKGTSCEGDDAQLKVRVWNNAASGAFTDNIVNFRDLRFTNNGMAFVIAIVPEGDDFDIPKPDTWSRLEEFGVINDGGTTDTTVPTGDSTADTTGDSTADTTAATGDTTADTTADTSAPTTGG